jgi:DNA ligase-1
MEFADFAAAAGEIERQSADEAIRKGVVDLLGAAGADLPVVARYVQGRVFPAHDATKLDVGPRLCYEAVAKAAGRNVDADGVEERVADVGDVGAVAADLELGSQTGLGAFVDGDSDSLTVAEVDERLRAVAAAE